MVYFVFNVLCVSHLVLLGAQISGHEARAQKKPAVLVNDVLPAPVAMLFSVLSKRSMTTRNFSNLFKENTTAFYASNREIMLKMDNRGPFVFKMRGFSYSNSRIGEGAPTDDSSGGWDSLQRPEICQQDFDLMRKINANALKVSPTIHSSF